MRPTVETAITETKSRIKSHIAEILSLAPELSLENRVKLEQRLEAALKEIRNGITKSDTERIERKK
jgi:hypothetical protein